jgi:hypothetical protein
VLENSSKRSSKVHIEDGVDDGVEEGVDVTQPHEEAEQLRLQAALGSRVFERVANTNGIDDVYCEKWRPT